MKKLSLTEARKKNKLKEFIKQNKNKTGKKEQFEQALKSMVNKLKSTHQTSEKDSSEN